MNYLLAIISGAIASTSFAPFSFWPAAFIALALWYYLLLRSKIISRLLISYLFGLGLLLPTQQWTGIYVGNAPWLALCFMQAIFFIVPAFFVGKGRRFNQFTFATSYVLVELLLRTLPFTGFGWSRLGYTQIDSPLSPLYPSGGVVLLTFFIACLSSARSLKSLAALISIGFVFTLLPGTNITNEKIKVALVQGGVGKLGLDFNSKPQEVFLRHLKQSGDSIKADQVDLIIWPENAVDVDVNSVSTVRESVIAQSKALKTPILIGGVTKSTKGPQNQSILFNPDIKQVYTKRYLTPFGEYLPMRSVASRFSQYANQVDDFVGGESDTVFEIGKVTFQSLICYEILDDALRDKIQSDFLVVQTNNATFGDTAQLDQELNIARVRAAESGRYIPYVSTTGVTTLIDNRGNIIKDLPKFESATLFGEIEKVNGSTFTQVFGEYLEAIAIIWLLVILALRRRGSR